MIIVFISGFLNTYRVLSCVASVFAGHSEGVTCCAWSPDGRVAASGAASGELRLSAPPPAPRLLHHEPVAHDLGTHAARHTHTHTLSLRTHTNLENASQAYRAATSRLRRARSICPTRRIYSLPLAATRSSNYGSLSAER